MITVEQSGSNYKIKNDMTGDATFEEIADRFKLAIVGIAQNEITEAVAGGFDKDYRTKVDNKFGKPVLAVNPWGKIEFYAQTSDVTQVLKDTYASIARRTTIGETRMLMSSNVVFFNGVLVARNKSEFNSWLKDKTFKTKDRIRFVNLAPYARKMELNGNVGKLSLVKSKKFKMKVKKPNGAYWLSQKDMHSKHAYMKDKIKFVFLPISPSIASSFHGGRMQKNGSPFRYNFKKDGRPYLYPTIRITLSDDIKGVDAGYTETGAVWVV